MKCSLRMPSSLIDVSCNNHLYNSLPKYINDFRVVNLKTDFLFFLFFVCLVLLVCFIELRRTFISALGIKICVN